MDIITIEGLELNTTIPNMIALPHITKDTMHMLYHNIKFQVSNVTEKSRNLKSSILDSITIRNSKGEIIDKSSMPLISIYLKSLLDNDYLYNLCRETIIDNGSNIHRIAKEIMELKYSEYTHYIHRGYQNSRDIFTTRNILFPHRICSVEEFYKFCIVLNNDIDHTGLTTGCTVVIKNRNLNIDTNSIVYCCLDKNEYRVLKKHLKYFK